VLAVTGKAPEQVRDAILHAADEDGETPRHLDDTAFRHPARAVELLGFDLFDTQGRRIDAMKDIPRHAQVTRDELGRALINAQP
jgi:hypothetical protein